MADGQVKCNTCFKRDVRPVPRILHLEQVDGKVVHNDVIYSQCVLCMAVVTYRVGLSVQVCIKCETNGIAEAEQMGRHCLYCKDYVSSDGYQTFRARRRADRPAHDVFFCKKHKVYPSDQTSTFLYDELLSMVGGRV